MKKVITLLNDALDELRKTKPGDRSDRDRKYAICITQTEILIAIISGLFSKEVINE
jgi:hypothetical protein